MYSICYKAYANLTSGKASQIEKNAFIKRCRAMYPRILKRYLEFGELVPYEKRLKV